MAVKEGDNPMYTGMDISIKEIVCTSLYEDGNIVLKDIKLNGIASFYALMESIVVVIEGIRWGNGSIIHSEGKSLE